VARTSVRGKTLSIRLYTIMKGTLFIWATSETLLLIIDRVPWLPFYRVHCQLTQNFLCLVLRQLKPQVFYYGNLVFECKKRSSERLDVMSGLHFKLKSVTIKASEFNLPETLNGYSGCVASQNGTIISYHWSPTRDSSSRYWLNYFFKFQCFDN